MGIEVAPLTNVFESDYGVFVRDREFFLIITSFFQSFDILD
jgi:hypothetical protein